jgi:NhaP-type Na+/H+ or K+/H+ antiporter
MSDAAWTAVAVAGIAAAYALGSRRLAGTPVSAAMVFVGFGVLLGPAGLDLVSLQEDAGPLRTLAEIALTLVLFTDATTVPLTDLRSAGALPGRLLSIGLILTIGAGWLLAWPILSGLTVWEMALVGVILAPTDAALGKNAISDPRVPVLVRRTLNVESGLNDGLVLPFFALFLAAIPGTSYAGEGADGTLWRALLLSTALGLAVGGIGGRLLAWSLHRGWVTVEWRQIFVLALAVGAYALAAGIQGSGFIAAWVAGLSYARVLGGSGPSAVKVEHTTELAEYLGALLAMLSLLFFGAVLLGPALQHLSWPIAGYAILSLTVIRALPVALALTGSRLKRPTVAFIGWFGPRGLASVVFSLLVAEEHIQNVDLIGHVVAITIGFSVLLHGMSAAPLAARYGRWYRQAATTPGLRESTITPAPSPRRRLGPPDPSQP